MSFWACWAENDLCLNNWPPFLMYVLVLCMKYIHGKGWAIIQAFTVLESGQRSPMFYIMTAYFNTLYNLKVWTLIPLYQQILWYGMVDVGEVRVYLWISWNLWRSIKTLTTLIKKKKTQLMFNQEENYF